jgi:hypothetical protein
MKKQSAMKLVETSHTPTSSGIPDTTTDQDIYDFFKTLRDKEGQQKVISYLMQISE